MFYRDRALFEPAMLAGLLALLIVSASAPATALVTVTHTEAPHPMSVSLDDTFDADVLLT